MTCRFHPYLPSLSRNLCPSLSNQIRILVTDNKMALKRFKLLSCWHGGLGLQRQVLRSWHCDRLREEELELREARTYLEKISEASDVLFSISRARHDGFDIQPLPSFFDRRYMLAYLYMVGKFSSRWLFFMSASLLCRAPHAVREVVNPTKDEKLLQVATRHRIDPIRFTRVCRKLLRIWPLLP